MRRLLAAITLSLISSGAIATGGTSPAHDQVLIAGQAGDRAEQPDTSPQQLALVIGNSGYSHRPLATPGNDARTMAGLLRASGFSVQLLEDAGAREMRAALEAFGRRLGSGATGLVYYAGHGLSLEDSIVLLPVDAAMTSAAAVRDVAIELDSILARMAASRPDGVNLVILDMCLDNPFAGRNSGSTDGPAHVQLPDRTLLAFSTAAGSVAYDGTGSNGPFVTGLLDSMPESGPDSGLDSGLDSGPGIQEIFTRTSRAVSRQTGSRQIPWMLSTLGSGHDFMLSTPAPLLLAALPAEVAGVTDGGTLTRGISPGDARYELEFWNSIKDSTEASDYEAYLEAYPDGRFAPLARARAERYRKSAAQPAKPVPPVYKVEEMDVDYVAVTDANLRDKPSTDGKRIGEVRAGQRIHVTGRLHDRKWYRVKTKDGKVAYVFANLLKVPAAKPPPKPVAKKPPAKQPVAKKPVTSKPPPPPPALMQHTFEISRDCPACPEMVSLPPGTFTMGNNRGDKSERPAHKVTIGSGFALGKHEVTAEQWSECVKAGACTYKPGVEGAAAGKAVRDISWSDARQYVQWLSSITGKKYRLPTEAEWEYAARAGTTGKYWWGDKGNAGKADCKDCGGTWDRKSPADIDAFPANPFGLHGMNGGVWEWVNDCWNNSHQGAPSNGRSRDAEDCRVRVIRGGSWRNDTSYVTSTSRFKYDADVRYLLNGFRVAREP